MDSHCVQFYESNGALAERAIAFIDRGAAAGRPTLAVVTQQLRERLDEWWKSDLANEFIRQSYHVLDAEQTLAEIMVNGWPNRERFEAVLGAAVHDIRAGNDGTVQILGEMVALLCGKGRFDAALQLESFCNEFLTVEPAHVLCCYPLSLFVTHNHQAVFQAVCAAHNLVRPTEVIDTDDPQELAREATLLQYEAATLKFELSRNRSEQSASGNKHNLLDVRTTS